ncbi:MAG: hypothetical protein JW743_02385 [Deltaproteobacteria bacterium]|nr:hypothetical protein [Deltaproteobacteria bacterium]MBN2846630.1 hypothetical protein [Deltaproteobacteria bacterium]
MPIKYTVENEGRLVHVIASGRMTNNDLLDYETAFANDDRIMTGPDVLFEIKPDSIVTITDNGMLKAIEQKEKLAKKAKSYRCAIVISGRNREIWGLAKLYKKMNESKSPNVITIVFSDVGVAQKWLGIK